MRYTRLLTLVLLLGISVMVMQAQDATPTVVVPTISVQENNTNNRPSTNVTPFATVTP